MNKLGRYKFAYILLASLILFSFPSNPAPAYAWSAVTAELESDFPLVRVWNRFRDFLSFFRGKESPQVVITNKGTHQLMMQLAYQLLEKDPAYIDQKEYFPTIDGILDWEGVVVKLDRVVMEGGEWRGTNAKSGGPDAAGKSPDSYHYYNPRLEDGQRGNADTAVERHFTEFLMQMYNQGDFNNRNKPNTDTNHNAAWSAHYLADVYVPYHTVGIFTDELKVLRGQLSPQQAGPDYLYKPEEAVLIGSDIDPNSIEKPPEWSGLNSNFEDVYQYYKDRYSGDWFDPWYYNRMAGIPGFGPNTKIGSHQIWEAWAHDNITNGKLYKVPPYYSKDWHNANPKLGSLLSNIENQAVQAKAFAVAAANETKGNMAVYTKSPDAAFNKATERVATLWRASLTALRPKIEVLQLGDPTKLKVRGTVKNVAADEIPTGIQMKLTVSGGTIAGDVATRAKPVVHTINDTFEWDVTVTDPKSCRLKLEVVGIYKTTPDLGYAFIEKELNQTPQPSLSTPPAPSTTFIDLTQYKKCQISFTVIDTKAPPQLQDRNSWSYTATFNGSFTGNTFKGTCNKQGGAPYINEIGQCSVTVAPTSDPSIWKITSYSMQAQYQSAPWIIENIISGQSPMELIKRDGLYKEFNAYIQGSNTCKYINGFQRILTGVNSDKVADVTPYKVEGCKCNERSNLYVKFTP